MKLVATLLGLLLPTLTSLAGELQLTLPPVIYAVAGTETAVYHDNIVLTQTPEAYRFEFRCAIGQSDARRWSVKPTDQQLGDHPVEITVRDATGRVLESARTTLHVSASHAGEKQPLTLLIIGDSLTHATHYPNDLARRLTEPGNPAWSMLGTHIPKSAAPGVAHEGYGGWKWTDFLTKYSPQAAGATAGPLAKKTSSPFLFPDAAGKPVFDLPRYFRESCGGRTPDVVTFLLGINDCFAANPDAPDEKITAVLAEAEKLLAEFRRALPRAQFAIGLTTPPNARQSGFTANYKDKYTRWGWKRIQHRLVQRMLAQFSRREAENLHLVPVHLGLDPLDGYPVDNGVHPNPFGYAQIAAGFHAWLKSRY